MLALCIGAWRFDGSVPSTSDGILPWIGSHATLVGRVVSREKMAHGEIVILRVEHIQHQAISPPGYKIEVRFYGRRALPVGSRLAVTCDVRSTRIDSQNMRFWHARAKRGVWVECAGSTQVTLLSKPKVYDAFAHLDAWRRLTTARIERLYPHEDATLLSGILYGDQELSRDQRERMRRAGLLHLVAVSGSNVTIVVNLLLAALLGVGLHRRRAFWVATCSIVAFLGFVGFSASVVRAGIMGWLALFARQRGRIPSASRLLLITATVMTFVNPWLLVFDAGFALSFLATWGILSWTAVIAERATWLPKRFGVREAFATTAGATLMTAPYLAWAFGRLSLAGLFTNLLAFPLIPWLMFWGAISAAWGQVPGSILLSLPAYGMLRMLDWIARLADLVPFLDFQFRPFGFVLCAAWYLVLCYIWRSLRAKNDLFTASWNKKDDFCLKRT